MNQSLYSKQSERKGGGDPCVGRGRGVNSVDRRIVVGQRCVHIVHYLNSPHRMHVSVSVCGACFVLACLHLLLSQQSPENSTI
jgi:hypothetical protein